MIIPIDPDQFQAAGMTYDEAGDVATFGLPSLEAPDELEPVEVVIKEGELHLFPQRSSRHKRILKALGLNE